MDDPSVRPLHGWFGLSYAAYLVLPRLLLCHMPAEWQQRFADLMKEYEGRYPQHLLGIEYRVRRIDPKGRFMSDPLANYRHGIPMPQPDAQETT